MIENAEAQIQGSGRLVQYSSHNLWLDIAYARGLIVLSIYIYFSIWALLSAWKILKDYKLKNQPEYNLLLGLEAGLIVFFISGVGSASMLSENLSTLFWFMLGSIAVLTKNINARERSCTEVTTAESN
jgi:O-antigen ligase